MMFVFVGPFLLKRILKLIFLEFPGSPVVRTLLPLQGAWVRPLVGELRSCMPQGMAKKIIFYDCVRITIDTLVLYIKAFSLA